MPAESSLLVVFLPDPHSPAARPQLAQALGPAPAALIHRRLVRDLFAGLEGLDGSMVVRILFEPSTGEGPVREWLHGLRTPAALRPQFAPQLQGDAADKLRHAFREAFAEGYRQVFAMGTSCPALSASILRQAAAALEECDAVFSPSSGGEPCLTGCSRFEPRLFDVPWESATTFRAMVARAAEAGMSTRLLPAQPRVETAAEWTLYKEELLRRMPVPKAPLVFQPHYVERVWGGRALETRLGRALPPGQRVGESWELVDRPEVQSLVADGPLMGLSLGDLWSGRRTEVFGPEAEGARFPLLFKILDAAQNLSLQVHPPAQAAAELGGEPKTEMWYVAGAGRGARIYAGLRPGVTAESFRAALQSGTAVSLVHSLEPAPGDCLFIPSGRLHALGAGLLVYEIQENSDTTYRVFDWHRTGPDGNPRPLHIEESLKSIRFEDAEPGLARTEGESLVRCGSFHVRKWLLQPHQTRAVNDANRFAIVTVVAGAVHCGGRNFREGDSFLVPACAAHVLDLRAGDKPATVLHASVPRPAAPRALERLQLPRESANFYRDLRLRIVAWAEQRTGGKHHPWLRYILLAPDFFLLLAGLLADREVPGKMKTLLATAIAYFVLPIDLFPEGFLGPAGYLDDVALAAFAINQLVNHVNPDIIRRHWAGDGDVLALVQSIIARVDSMIGSGLVRQIRNRLGL